LEAKIGAPTILMVDDSEDTCALREELLRNDGYRVIAVADEASAVGGGDGRADLILLSQQMPTLDVIAAGCRIRQASGLAPDVPVVVLPTEAVDVRGVDLPLGHNVRVVYLSEFRHLEILLGTLLHERAKAASGA
jgi:CheY-like chemotaxis protein